MMFAINTDGTDFTALHEFSAQDDNHDNSDGANPQGDLVLSGNILYGTTQNGGSNGAGTMFAIGTNGTSFTVTHIFTGGSDGGFPAGLSLSGGTLFGATVHGGSSSDDGVIYSIVTNSTALTAIYNFAPVNLGDPWAGLVLSGGRLNGTTKNGGTNDNGTVFAVNTNGTGYTILHSFGALVNNTYSDGVTPLARAWSCPAAHSMARRMAAARMAATERYLPLTPTAGFHRDSHLHRRSGGWTVSSERCNDFRQHVVWDGAREWEWRSWNGIFGGHIRLALHRASQFQRWQRRGRTFRRFGFVQQHALRNNSKRWNRWKWSYFCRQHQRLNLFRPLQFQRVHITLC